MTASGERVVAIDCFPESAARYGSGWAVVAVDVIRAGTSAVTAVAMGRRCVVARSVEHAQELAALHPDWLLVGELGGSVPFGFHMPNSPSRLSKMDGDVERPMVLLSTSGTRLLWEAAGADEVYVGSLRNLTAQTRWLAERHPRVALIGAGSRGEFREEDQFGCACLASGLLDGGYRPQGLTAEVVERWADRPLADIGRGRSAAFLEATGQLDDLCFVLDHVDDMGEVFVMRDGEVVRVDTPAG